MMNLMDRRTLITLVVLAGLGGAFFGVRYYIVSSQQTNLVQSAVAMHDILGHLDFSTTTIERYRSLDRAYLTADMRAQRQIKLGHAYDLSGQYQTGIPLIKSVIADRSVPPDTRAFAIGFLFLAITTDRDKSVAQFILDDGGIYKEALGSGDLHSLPDLMQGMHQLLVTADGWYQTSFIKYRLAFQASGDLLDHTDLSATQKQADTKVIAEDIAAGDALRTKELARSDFQYSLFQYLDTLGLSSRLFDLTTLARFDTSYQSRADEAYQQLMRRYGPPQNQTAFFVLSSYTRFYYAAYLADVFGAARAADITDIMAPTLTKDGLQGKANVLGIWKFYQTELTRDKADRNHNERFILSVAKYDPDFNTFLTSRGWK